MSDSNLNIDGQVKISFSPGKMHAYLEVSAPIGSGAPCKREQVLKALQENDIVYGIDEKVIDQILEEQNWGKRTLVAKGLEPQDGVDGKLIFKFPLINERLELKEDEKGRIDYHERGLIHNVKMGELLVERIPPTEGIPGHWPNWWLLLPQIHCGQRSFYGEIFFSYLTAFPLLRLLHWRAFD
jgi:uncharacterized protein (DUF342 family)